MGARRRDDLRKRVLVVTDLLLEQEANGTIDCRRLLSAVSNLYGIALELLSGDDGCKRRSCCVYHRSACLAYRTLCLLAEMVDCQGDDLES